MAKLVFRLLGHRYHSFDTRALHPLVYSPDVWVAIIQFLRFISLVLISFNCIYKKNCIQSSDRFLGITKFHFILELLQVQLFTDFKCL